MRKHLSVFALCIRAKLWKLLLTLAAAAGISTAAFFILGLEIVRAADARNFDCMIDHPRGAERVERRGDDAGLCGHLAQLLRQARLADEHV